MVEIIKIELAFGLKFVEVIEETERERCPWLFEGGREPFSAKKLETRRDGESFTAAVLDTDSCDTGNIKELDLVDAGWDCATLLPTVTELVDGTEIEQRNRDEELSGPFLKSWLEGSREKTLGYLDAMQSVGLMDCHNARMA